MWPTAYSVMTMIMVLLEKRKIISTDLNKFLL